MPTREPKLSPEEQRKFSALALRLQAAGVRTGTSGLLLLVPKSVDLWQLEYLFCRVHELPGSRVAVILLCELVALRAGAAIRDCAIWLPWGPELDLCDPEDILWYHDLVRGLPQWAPTVLNPYLRGEAQLPRGRKLTGFIIATGPVAVPAECCDDSPVGVQLLITDYQGNQLELLWNAGVDRSFKHAYDYDRRQPTHAEAVRLAKQRGSLFEREDPETRYQARTGPERSRGPISPSPVVVSVEKPREGSSTDVPRDETDETSGAV